MLIQQIAFIKKITLALAGWLSLLEHHSIHQHAGGLIPVQGTYLARLWVRKYGRELVNVSHINVSLSLSLKSINISLGEGLKKITLVHIIPTTI